MPHYRLYQQISWTICYSVLASEHTTKFEIRTYTVRRSLTSQDPTLSPLTHKQQAVQVEGNVRLSEINAGSQATCRGRGGSGKDMPMTKRGCRPMSERESTQAYPSLTSISSVSAASQASCHTLPTCFRYAMPSSRSIHKIL